MCVGARFRIGFRGRATVPEHVLRSSLALTARPVDRRTWCVGVEVADAVERHQFEVVGHLEQRLDAAPLLRHLHRERDELDAHLEFGRRQPEVLHRGAETEHGVEARQLARSILGSVEQCGEDQRRTADQFAVRLGERRGHPEPVHQTGRPVGADETTKRPESARESVEQDPVTAAIHLAVGEPEVAAVPLEELPGFEHRLHRTRADVSDRLDDRRVVDQHEPPGLAVEVGRRHPGDVDEEPLVLDRHRFERQGPVRGAASGDDVEELHGPRSVRRRTLVAPEPFGIDVHDRFDTRRCRTSSIPPAADVWLPARWGTAVSWDLIRTCPAAPLEPTELATSASG